MSCLSATIHRPHGHRDGVLPYPALQKWGVAMYDVLTARKGISSKELTITQKTAWFLLQRIREACRREEFKVDLIAEIDAVYIGGRNKNRHLKDRPKIGQEMGGKRAVLGIHQRRGPTKALPVAQTDMATLYPIIEQHVEAGAFVCTDDHGTSRNLNRLGSQHRVVAHSAGEYVTDGAHANGIESVWAVLKRSLLGVHHWVSTKHLARYLNEATFRLHEGNCSIDTIDRLRTLGQGLSGKRLTYRRLIHGLAPFHYARAVQRCCQTPPAQETWSCWGVRQLRADAERTRRNLSGSLLTVRSNRRIKSYETVMEQTMKPIVTLMFLFTVLFIGSQRVQAESANPFGFEMTKHPLEYEFCKKEPGFYRGHAYSCNPAPRPHPDLEWYSLQFVKGIGLCRLHTGAKNFRPDLAFNNALEILKDQIAKKYGPPTKETKQEEKSIHAQERQMYWSPEAGCKGLGAVKTIEVWASETIVFPLGLEPAVAILT